MRSVAITGAGGFLGRALVSRARHLGYEVLALTRATPDPGWAEDAGITPVMVDLANADSIGALAPRLAQTEAVIHAAASFGGDAAAHERDTIRATEHLIKAMKSAGSTARLVQVSSLSVYDVAAMQDHEILDENSPLLGDASQRDAYGAAKMAQERLVQEAPGEIRIIRPGAIYGPGRLWSAQLGFAKAGLVFCPGGDGAVPALHVTHAAIGLLNAAHPDQHEPVVNLIDTNPPTQRVWLRALHQKTLYVPRGLVLAAGRLLARGPAWSARFRPLQYDTTRADCLLQGAPEHSFPAAMAALRPTRREVS